MKVRIKETLKERQNNRDPVFKCKADLNCKAEELLCSGVLFKKISIIFYFSDWNVYCWTPHLS